MSWEKMALWAGVILTIITILGKAWAWPFRWVGRQFAKLLAFSGRRMIWALIRSDTAGSRAVLLALMKAERDEALARSVANSESITSLQRLVGSFESRLVELEEDQRMTHDEMQKSRAEMRGDLAVATARLEHAHRDLRASIEKLAEEMRVSSRRMNRTLHTVVGIVAGPDVAKEELRRMHHELVIGPDDDGDDEDQVA